MRCVKGLVHGPTAVMVEPKFHKPLSAGSKSVSFKL